MNHKPSLSEKDFIHESYQENPYPLVTWLFFIIILGVTILGVKEWQASFMEQQYAVRPFLQVSNRNFSIFLWQHPELMRVTVQKKSDYLPGFRAYGRPGIKDDKADDYVIVPPERLHHYHLWNRLIGNQLWSSDLSGERFKQFLVENKEWSSVEWQHSKKIQQAFSGWTNYFFEGGQINEIRPTYGEMRRFVEEHPSYSRSYWRNLYPNYLKSISHEIPESEQVPLKEIPAFLRVALFNANHHPQQPAHPQR